MEKRGVIDEDTPELRPVAGCKRCGSAKPCDSDEPSMLKTALDAKQASPMNSAIDLVAEQTRDNAKKA